MVMPRLFSRPKPCGPLCQEVEREIDALRLAEHLEQLGSQELKTYDARRLECGE
ncbi:hypothetical protein BOA8489_00462 [Boseongicola aestuarii]|jgi:hypothetical protein|uniref:Uncharacterized protein n=1 Tax=Boseongicola aestuarii TaxID=1470561 RepID=A0A238IVF6_9RHOB|nr:hypothetical protein BOA8489_00462 [Boseongicola aestuarii]